MAAPSSVAVLAPAKINLTLQIVGRRPDGFHDLHSWVAPLDLSDELRFTLASDDGIKLMCNDPGVGPTERNLAVRAATTLAHASGIEPRLTIELSKRIPIAAGLGGGSSDAAATLLALNRLWALDWPIERLAAIGADIGSDVPLFVYGAPCLIEGRGERVTPLSRGPAWSVVLVLPAFGVSTTAVYRELRASDRAARIALPDLIRGAADDPMPNLFNDLEAPAFRVEPRLGELHNELEQDFCRPVRMSGSGSTLFTLFNDDRAARDWQQRVDSARNDRFQTRLCTTWFSVWD